MGRSQRILLVLAATLVVVVAFVFAGSGSSSKSPPGVRHFHIVAVAGKPVGGVQKLTANRGDTIDLQVSSDVADEIHLHGYDLHTNVTSGRPAQLKFRATIEGNFVIEFESRSTQIAALTVKA
ncbi:MAG: hypothetical protein ACR2ND_14865 [Solirubrobacteraceae bacterium]